MARPRRVAEGEVPESETIRRAQHGDPEAFERLYRLHSRRVYSVVLRMVGNPAEAEDLTQEAFLQLFRKIHTFRGDAAFTTWLHRLSVNVVLMRLRKKTLPQTSLDEPADNEDETSGPKRDVGAEDPLIEGSVDRVHLERAVAELPPGYRMVFLLHDVQGYEHNEIARIMDCSIGNSKSQLHKARTRLREILQDRARDEARQQRLEASEKTGSRD